MNYSEEEQKAIERFKSKIKRADVGILKFSDVYTTLDIHNLRVLLNLIEKQSKEIEELKEDNKHQWEERCKLTFELENSTSNDKIKAKIEEIDNIFKNNRLIDKLKNYFEAQKEVLQSLLEKE